MSMGLVSVEVEAHIDIKHICMHIDVTYLDLKKKKKKAFDTVW